MVRLLGVGSLFGANGARFLKRRRKNYYDRHSQGICVEDWNLPNFDPQKHSSLTKDPKGIFLVQKHKANFLDNTKDCRSKNILYNTYFITKVLTNSYIILCQLGRFVESSVKNINFLIKSFSLSLPHNGSSDLTFSSTKLHITSTVARLVKVGSSCLI